MEMKTLPIKALYQRFEESNRTDLPLLSVYRELGVVPRAGREDNHNVVSEDLTKYKVVKPGYLVVNKMKTWQGSLAISSIQGIVSPAYYVARKIGEVEDRFIHHLLRSAPMIAEYGARSKGIRPGQWDLPWDEFASIRVQIPTYEKQVEIADYLDEALERNSVLAEKIQAQIPLLYERRQSLITAALTGNLEF